MGQNRVDEQAQRLVFPMSPRSGSSRALVRLSGPCFSYQYPPTRSPPSAPPTYAAAAQRKSVRTLLCKVTEKRHIRDSHDGYDDDRRNHPAEEEDARGMQPVVEIPDGELMNRQQPHRKRCTRNAKNKEDPVPDESRLRAICGECGESEHAPRSSNRAPSTGTTDGTVSSVSTLRRLASRDVRAVEQAYRYSWPPMLRISSGSHSERG